MKLNLLRYGQFQLVKDRIPYENVPISQHRNDLQSGGSGSEVEEGLRKQLIEKINTNFAEVATVCTSTRCSGGDATTLPPSTEVPQIQGDKPGMLNLI